MLGIFKKLGSWTASFGTLVRNAGRVVGMVWRDQKGLVTTVVLTTVFIAFIPFVRSGSQALLVNELVNVVSGAGAQSRIYWLIAFVAAATIVPDLVYSFKSFLDKRLWLHTQEKFELLMLKKRGEIDIATYENPAFRDTLNKAEERGVWPAVNTVQTAFFSIQNVIEVALASTVLFVADWKVFLLILLGAIPDFLVEAKYGQRTWDIYDTNAETRRRFFATRGHFYGIADLLELKLFQNVRKFYKIVEGMLVEFNGHQRRLDMQALRWRSASVLATGAAVAAAIALVIFDVVNDAMEIGTMIFVLGSIYQFQGALSGFLMNVAQQYERSNFVSEIFNVLDTEAVIKTLPGAKKVSSATPEIEFENVSFRYPGTEKTILRDFSLRIAPGEKLAFVGINGAGKTTFVKLLCRIYDPTAGRILVDGVDLREIDRESWYGRLGVLFQDYSLYNLLVREGIALGRSEDEASMDRVLEASEASDSHPFIDQWTDKYDQMIGKEFTGGIDPSKGQRQKLALARIFYRDPSVLVLDEPTASIDASAEALIFEKLEALPRDKTVVLISHRFSTVRKADRICVIEDGTISELGSHHELMEKPRTYARLFELQAKGYK